MSTIRLTPEQHEAIAQNGAETLRAIDPETNVEYVLMTAATFARLQELLNLDANPADAYPAIDKAFAEGWSDPRMDEYDRYEELRG